jgi:hypothetical protein
MSGDEKKRTKGNKVKISRYRNKKEVGMLSIVDSSFLLSILGFGFV